MTDLMRTLYEYTREKEMRKYLLDEEYHQVQHAVKYRCDKLLERDPKLFDALDELLSEIYLGHSFEQEAMFQATLALSEALRQF